ncbi:glutamate-5-semialdehyde dehydrogenase [Patulibacter sp. SYSU D01012]|uniref:glutamate-5-semialdehyde dehydrogenase n=1 Tax=Patulibacter sp. SYSU D01012 TaxID=2817381 RepID=UPI001B30813C|nr:glutamate-5-semialdehyde dehydrogenase [Patulibacter sp. SYSU D01012]
MSVPATEVSSVVDVCRRARAAGRRLAAVDTHTKDAALSAIADALLARAPEILEANARDLEAGAAAGLPSSLMDRLRLDDARLAGIVQGVRDVIALRDPVGETIEGYRLPNGLEVQRQRIPLGVVAVVYEARPNVTIDAVALAIKSGNAIVLRGSSSALHSNRVLAAVAADAAAEAGLPDGCIGLVSGGGREELAELATQDAYVDLIVPRGGEGLKAALKGVATVPVIFAAAGIGHVYVDAAADLAMAVDVVENSKVHRPSACNAAETVLVHREVAAAFLPAMAERLGQRGVELRADADALPLVDGRGATVVPATEQDWDTEHLALILGVRLVDDVFGAIDHVETHGSGHSDAIVSRDAGAIRAFERGVSSAAVYVNASTRFTDGGEFGMGAEIGISTQKLHARGPIGLRELTTYRYLVRGDGHVRS